MDRPGDEKKLMSCAYVHRAYSKVSVQPPLKLPMRIKIRPEEVKVKSYFLGFKSALMFKRLNCWKLRPLEFAFVDLRHHEEFTHQLLHIFNWPN